MDDWYSEQRQLAGLAHPGERAEIAELLDVRLGKLVTAHGKLLDRNKLLSRALLYRVLRGGVAKPADTGQRRKQAVFDDQKLRCL